ncbi:MAG TPA: type I-E CRISPR-associated protein Cas7/Cse4/CasC [Candidatus Hydrogenedentes bacterium]|nr:type I-E CRISPR-associated protein Cas7/Cse4/CasC [Candidatus Hydrogenedentota bacterium]HOL75723.1 type I-E CRISPR-associated protein Cas7/Cse4/CasC [Candidatus Hydrogenedentota bacterium]HPO84284.1 type I-E CRISPR-associated protein Cas7/Cse4/CasC [Candidatus Hydrogenedentota bacterium]
MLIQVHLIQNHNPSNLNRDDLGAPKTCYFGGVLRARISSQCLKRAIRTSKEFQKLLGGVRTRRLAWLIAEAAGDPDLASKVEGVLEECGFKQQKSKPKQDVTDEDDLESTPTESKMLVYTTGEAIKKMAQEIKDTSKDDKSLAEKFAKIIAENTAVPDMALCGRMLEPSAKIWKDLNTTVEAALQVAHAFSTHAVLPETDYYVAADDVPGRDAGAGYVDTAMFLSACFYKYFSINWETLTENLVASGKDHEKLAAHTVGAFIKTAALVNPSGKQNSYAAHNLPDGLLVEIRDVPISYANAFVAPVRVEDGNLVEQSISQLAHYVYDLDVGYGAPQQRFWFSPNLRYKLVASVKNENGSVCDKDLVEKVNAFSKLEELVDSVIEAIGYDWEEVQKLTVEGIQA